MAPVVFAQTNAAAPTETVTLTHEVWIREPQMNSTRLRRRLVANVGAIVAKADADKWGVGGTAKEPYYFVEPEGTVEVLDTEGLLARGRQLDIAYADSLGSEQLRRAIEAKEAETGDGEANEGEPAPSRKRQVKTTSKPGPDETSAQPGPKG